MILRMVSRQSESKTKEYVKYLRRKDGNTNSYTESKKKMFFSFKM